METSLAHYMLGCCSIFMDFDFYCFRNGLHPTGGSSDEQGLSIPHFVLPVSGTLQQTIQRRHSAFAVFWNCRGQHAAIFVFRNGSWSFVSWGVLALRKYVGSRYGNWLIDEDLLHFPGYIFVISCSIIPAACRLGQIHSNWDTFAATKFACKQVRRVRKVQAVASIFNEGEIPPPNYWVNSAGKRKEFLLTFFKNELNCDEQVSHDSFDFRRSKHPQFIVLPSPEYFSISKTPTFSICKMEGLCHWLRFLSYFCSRASNLYLFKWKSLWIL